MKIPKDFSHEENFDLEDFPSLVGEKRENG